ncbi:flavonoid 3'-monooxygenase-like [Macadamia integrifolia]|uniref:flavonoid 3'-monooxygenase-like n=1 Tax=Macadamia integrifolia TaxID=60698 RepID=UPI001C52F546|nr:flavonoid 3'-monooxygenase-like [Macadamia integrifolia]
MTLVDLVRLITDTACEEGSLCLSLVVLLVTVVVVSWYLWMPRILNKGKPPLPPGPRGLPFVGILPFLEAGGIHRYFAKLAETYGPIMKLQLGSKLCVVLSSSSTAKEVLKDHDAIFANRDPNVAAMTVSYGGSDITWSPNGANWRMMRKIFTQELMSSKSLDACYRLRQQEVRKMVREVYSKTGEMINISEMIFRTMFNLVLNMLCGGMLCEEDKVAISAELRPVIKQMIALVAKPNISDVFPVLAQFDAQGIRSEGKKLSSEMDRIFNSILERRLHMDDEMKGKGSKDNDESKDFLQILLQLKQEGDSRSLTIAQLKNLFLDAIAGATDSTSINVEWAMAELMLNPEKLKKAKEELDQVVGMNNIVEEYHLSKLPYLDVVLKEAHRLHPVVPLLVPHRSSESCTVGGYTVPKGATVFINVWKMHRDPDEWESPLEFIPERFLADSDKYDYRGNNFNFLPFGSGRRICVGIPLATKMGLYVMTSLLHSFDWELLKKEQLDLLDKYRILSKIATPLEITPTPRLPNQELYL